MIRPFIIAMAIVALRNEKGSYNADGLRVPTEHIVALRNEKGSYNKRVLTSRPV